MPATPPVRNAIFIARCSPSVFAAAATRTFPRTASHMPIYPVTPENTAPMTKKMLRPMRSVVVSAGSTKRTKKTMTAKMLRVLNWRLRYADAPSCTAAAISCILGVPSLAESTCRTRKAATTSAKRAMAATTMTVETFPADSSIRDLLESRRQLASLQSAGVYAVSEVDFSRVSREGSVRCGTAPTRSNASSAAGLGSHRCRHPPWRGARDCASSSMPRKVSSMNSTRERSTSTVHPDSTGPERSSATLFD